MLAGQQIQGLLILNYPTYGYERWHTTLLTFAVATFSLFFNTLLAKKLPLLEGIVLFVHIFGFFAILIVLWVMGPKGDAAEVFTTFNNYGGWSNQGTSALVGIFGLILSLLGADAAVHMSEELRDASKQLPRSMILTTVVNGLMGFIMIITFCMVIGNLDDVINTPTLQPFIAVFYQATQSLAGTNAMSALIIFMQMFCNLSIVATASRQLFAFARDHGMPFGPWLSYGEFAVPNVYCPVALRDSAFVSDTNVSSQTWLGCSRQRHCCFVASQLLALLDQHWQSSGLQLDLNIVNQRRTVILHCKYRLYCVEENQK